MRKLSKLPNVRQLEWVWNYELPERWKPIPKCPRIACSAVATVQMKLYGKGGKSITWGNWFSAHRCRNALAFLWLMKWMRCFSRFIFPSGSRRWSLWTATQCSRRGKCGCASVFVGDASFFFFLLHCEWKLFHQTPLLVLLFSGRDSQAMRTQFMSKFIRFFIELAVM